MVVGGREEVTISIGGGCGGCVVAATRMIYDERPSAKNVQHDATGNFLATVVIVVSGLLLLLLRSRITTAAALAAVPLRAGRPCDGRMQRALATMR